MIEFVDVFENDGQYFVTIEKDSQRFQFGISRNSYRSISRAMQVRPFDMMPGLKYRYFYDGSQRRVGAEDYSMDGRVELNRDATKKPISIPKELHSSLLWFSRRENLSDADYLKIEGE
ncbi:MAG: hypothetical protein ABJB34_10175 [Acidobacteriota bacterium]